MVEDDALDHVNIVGVARNKKPESILLLAKSGFEHTRNVLPLETHLIVELKE